MSEKGRFPFEYTPSGQNLKVQKDQVVFSQKGVAVLVPAQANKSLIDANQRARTKVERLTDPNHADRLRHYAVQGLYLRSLYKKGRLTDMTILAGGEQFHVHKVILTCRSKYFADMFRRKTRRASMNVTDATLEGVSADAVRLILNYFYGGVLSLDCANFAAVRAAGMVLGVGEVTAACEDYMNELFSKETALPLYAMASECGLDDIRARASGIICHNFHDIINSEDFLNLQPETLHDILQNENLKIESELECFKVGGHVTFFLKEKF